MEEFKKWEKNFPAPESLRINSGKILKFKRFLLLFYFASLTNQ